MAQDPLSLTSAAPSPGPSSTCLHLPGCRRHWTFALVACFRARPRAPSSRCPDSAPSASSAPCPKVTAPQFECPHFSCVGLCIFLLICCHRCVLTEITPLLTVRILMCPTTADIKCSLIPTRASPSGVCTFHTAGRGLLRENVPSCIESSEK